MYVDPIIGDFVSKHNKEYDNGNPVKYSEEETAYQRYPELKNVSRFYQNN